MVEQKISNQRLRVQIPQVGVTTENAQHCGCTFVIDDHSNVGYTHGLQGYTGPSQTGPQLVKFLAVLAVT